MVSLCPMSPAEFGPFAQRAVAVYAREKVSAGELPAEQAAQQADSEFKRLLPTGLQTPGHEFFVIRSHAAGAPVGALWVQQRQSGGVAILHVLDIHIAPEHRRCGYARAALQELEQHAARLGARELTLHVFGHNLAARALYAALGFRITDLSMAKTLGPAPSKENPDVC